eukprot:gene17880-21325_t
MVLNKRSLEQSVLNNNGTVVDGADQRQASKDDNPKMVSTSKRNKSSYKQPVAVRKVQRKFRHNRPWILLIGAFMFIYYLAMMYVRYEHRGLIGFADSIWLCNLAVIFGFVSIFVDQPMFIAVALNTTFIVHSIWAIDVAAYFLTGSFPFGNAENGGYPGSAIIGSWLLLFPVIQTSTFFPKEFVLENGSVFYLNINIAHEWWADMKGWPFSLIPGSNEGYLIFLYCFSAVLFTTTHLLMMLFCKFAIKKN